MFGSLCKKVEDRSTHRAAFEFSWQTREYTGAPDQIVRCAKLSQFTDFKENQQRRKSKKYFSAYTSRYITAWPIVTTTFGNDFHVKLVFVCKVCLHLRIAVSSGLCISSERWNVTFYMWHLSWNVTFVTFGMWHLWHLEYDICDIWNMPFYKHSAAHSSNKDQPLIGKLFSIKAFLVGEFWGTRKKFQKLEKIMRH